MRRLLLALAILAGAATPTAAGMADRVGATFGMMSTDLLRTFQPVEGLVVQIEGDEIFLDVIAAGGAQVGQEYTIFRKGDVFAHPTTGRILGRFEEVLGWAQIKRVHDNFSVGAFVAAPDRPRPRPEDGARITRGRIRVAVTPVLDLTATAADLRRVPFMLATSLDRTRRFQVIDPLAVGDMFANGDVRVEEVIARPERAVRTARNLDVSGWIVPILLERRGTVYLDLTYISAITGAPLFSQRQPLVPATAGEEQRFPWEPRIED